LRPRRRPSFHGAQPHCFFRVLLITVECSCFRLGES
jgi:hypothetical protein